jgi:EAL domain-containing protein (putative c-di-GMP-specific phosphodiesterase class I)
VVQAVVSLARDFGSETVAEGVEDADTLALLGELGVDHAQGFHLARPAPFAERPGDGGEPRRRRAPRRGDRARTRRPAKRTGVGGGVA